MPDKFQPLRDHHTNGANCGHSTDDVIARLKAWDEVYGLDVSDAGGDRVRVCFHSLPDDVAGLADEIYRFCPDIVDQHFGCFWIMYEDDDPADLPPGVAELIEGVEYDDFDDDSTAYGLELLRRALEQKRPLPLWWD